MKLFEHPDFEQAVIRAAEHFRARGLRESIIAIKMGPSICQNGAIHLSLNSVNVPAVWVYVRIFRCLSADAV